MTTRQLARATRFLANDGVDPGRGRRTLSAPMAGRVGALMLACATYDAAGEFAFDVGPSCKSGVASATIAAAPGRMGRCVWSHRSTSRATPSPDTSHSMSCRNAGSCRCSDRGSAAWQPASGQEDPMPVENGDRRLLVLRHAKASRDDAGLADHERPLSGRGRRALPRLQRELARRREPIDLVLCSSAIRARQTLEGVRDALPGEAAVAIEHGLYGASGTELVQRLRAVPASVTGVLLIGHNPGLEQLVHKLAGNGDPDALAQLATKYPTGALATLRVSSRWSALVAGSCHLDDLVLPRALG
jgi:phosphohistidine phosphatase